MARLTDNERIVLAVLATDYDVVPVPVADRILRDGLAGDQTFLHWMAQHIPPASVLQVVAAELGIGWLDLAQDTAGHALDPALNDGLDIEVFQRHKAVPLRRQSDGKVVIAAVNPLDVQLVDYVRTKLPDAEMHLCAPKQVAQKLADVSDAQFEATVDQTEDPDATAAVPAQRRAAAQASRAVQWVDQTLERALVDGASDIHFTWDVDKKMHLRMRVDGMLRELPMPLKRSEQREAIGALLAKCEGVDVTNTREPIDATFSFTALDRRIDVRLALLPQINGPTVVLRLLDPTSVRGSLDDKGFDPQHVAVLRSAVNRSQGMVVVTGPTGSGKSTTLYTLLGEIDAQQRNIHTVENPVEYRLPYVNQTQIRDDLGDRSITFSRALRSLLRLDPDVILVGEMRDDETAETGLDAAITGHLVLSTLHANDAIQTFSRLIEMGVPPYLVAEAITASISQRLVRTLHTCATSRPATAEEQALFARYGFNGVDEVPEPAGCGGCLESGYKGRAAVLEVLVPDRPMREAVTERASAGRLYRIAEQTGFRPMMADGLRLVTEGRVDVNEVRRVLVETENG